jgi:hypothetical protein
VNEELSAMCFAFASNSPLKGGPDAQIMANIQAWRGIFIKEKIGKGVATVKNAMDGSRLSRKFVVTVARFELVTNW